MNPEALANARNNRPGEIPVEVYVEGIRQCDRMLLSKAITLTESAKPDHQEKAQQLIEACLPYAGNALRIGITGVPGVGKSTFIEAIGKKITESGKKLAVLAIDPSSEKSGGSILGDKTRMNELAVNPDVYIRPSPSSGSLGGVAQTTRETMILFEAAGFDVIFVETVGVGQSETTVHSMVDFFLLLMLAGAGDELQGIKRGIMEMADAILITKADGDNLEPARRARAEYRNALHLYPVPESGWMPQVEISSALEGTGLKEVLAIIAEHQNMLKGNGWFERRREEQARFWMHDTIKQELGRQFYEHPAVKEALPAIEKRVVNGEISPFAGARQLLLSFTS